MHPDAIPAVEGSACDDPPDPSLLDFSGTANPERPAGVAGMYDAAFGESRAYPSNDSTRFREAAAAYVGCAPASVVPTTGGLRAIRLALGVAVSAGDSVLVPVPSYAEHDREIRLQGGRPTSVPYEELLLADPAEHAAVLACNPNDPTGDVFSAADLGAFAERCRDAGTILVLDEALIDFSDAPSLAGMPGIVVVRSLSKIFGLPGLRAGFAVRDATDHRRFDSHVRVAVRKSDENDRLLDALLPA